MQNTLSRWAVRQTSTGIEWKHEDTLTEEIGAGCYRREFASLFQLLSFVGERFGARTEKKVAAIKLSPEWQGKL